MAIAPFIFVTFLIGSLSLVGIFWGSTQSIDVGSFLQGGSFKLNLGFVGLLLFLLMSFFLIATIWIWRRNVVVITNKHIVDLDQKGLFNRIVSSQSLGRIQDVRSEIRGPMQTIFQYGTIIVQTAGESQNFRFDYIPHPYVVEKYILDTHQKYLKETAHGEDDGVSPHIGVEHAALGEKLPPSSSPIKNPTPPSSPHANSVSDEHTPLDELMK